MALTDPEPITTVGDAKIIRHVYLPDLTAVLKSYVVWTANVYGDGDRFLVRPMEVVDYDTGPILFDDVVLDTGPLEINNFALIETQTPNNVVILYDDGEYIWRIIYDFEIGQIISSPSKLYLGIIPTLTYDSFYEIVRTFYLKQNALQLRNNVTESESELIRHTAFFVLDQDVDDKPDTTLVYYTGRYMPNTNIALPFKSDGNTVLLYDRTVTLNAQWNLNAEDILNTTIAPFYLGYFIDEPIPGATGQVDEAIEFNFDDGSIVVYDNITVSAAELAISFWIYGKTDLPLNTIMMNGVDVFGYRVVNIHLPWSDSNIYWDCGNDAGPTYDRETAAAVPADFEGSWIHWVFQKNATTGNMEIWKNNTLFHSVTGKVKLLTNIVTLNLVSTHSAIIDDIAWIHKFQTPSEIDAIYNRGLAGLPLNTILVPDMKHYWTLDTEPVRGLEDLSGNGRDLVIGDDLIVDPLEGLIFNIDYECTYISWPVPVLLTIEAWVTPRFNYHQSRIMYGDLFLYYSFEGRIEFGFVGVSTHRLVQSDKQFLRKDQPNHIMVVHEFGTASNTFITVNGKRIEADWIEGDGTEDPSLGTIVSNMQLGREDILGSVKISSVLKTEAYALDYIEGVTQ